MNAECTHVCVYRLDDGGDGEKRFCNTTSEYRSYCRIQLTDQRGWDQYLSQKVAASGEVIATPTPPAAVVAVAAAPAVAVVAPPGEAVAVAAGEAGQSADASFFAPRSAAAAAGPVPTAYQTEGLVRS